MMSTRAFHPARGQTVATGEKKGLLGRVFVGVEHRVRNRVRQPERQPAPPCGGRELGGRLGRRRGDLRAVVRGGGGAAAVVAKAMLVDEGESDGLDQASYTADEHLGNGERHEAAYWVVVEKTRRDLVADRNPPEVNEVDWSPQAILADERGEEVAAELAPDLR